MKTFSAKILATEELEDFSVMIVNEFGEKIWRDKDGHYHREDGPAIEYPSGGKSWFQHGKYHREDGPAEEYSGGSKFYRLNGKEVSEADVRALGKMK